MAHKLYEVHLFGNGELAKCLTKLKSVGTKITALTVSEKGASFQTNRKGLKQIRKYRRRYGLKVTVETSSKDLGLMALFKANRFLILLLIPFVGSFFLWTIQIESDIPEVAERIGEKLDSASIVPLRPLMLIPSEDEIRRLLMADDPSLSWVRFKRSGASLTVIPMLSPPSDNTLEEKGPPSDLVARTGGVLTRFALTRGERIGFIHSTVKKGDILATGVLEQGEKKAIVGAEGAVFADYWVEYEFNLPKIIEYTVQGEETVAFKFKRPWKRAEDDTSPIWHIVTTNRQLTEETRQLELTEGMEDIVILPLIKRKLLAEQGPEATIKEDKILHVTFDNDNVKGTILFLVNDNIAVKRPISKETEASG